MRLPKAVIFNSWFIVNIPLKSCISTVKRWTGRNNYPTIALRPPGQRPSPHPVPKTRSRSLTLPTGEPENHQCGISTFLGFRPKYKRQRTTDQTQSMLLTKLPSELRSLIWEYAVGGQTLHIIPCLVPSLTRPSRYTLIDKGVYYRLDYELCKWQNEDWVGSSMRTNSHSACAIWVNGNGELYFNAPQSMLREDAGYRQTELRFLRWWVRKHRFLALLKTCRQIYTEAVPIMYSTNRFDFRNLGTLIQFETTVLPQRFNAIRSLTLQWVFMRGLSTLPSHAFQVADDEKWEKTCSCIARMKGLRNVLILLGDCRPSHSDKWLLEPLRVVKVNGPFVIRVNWPENPWERNLEVEDVPFEIRRDFAFHPL